MARFVDESGRLGPATWIGGRPRDGQEDHPVAGVSWYEAMAYARFRERALPTVYHWAAAALPDIEIIEPIAPALAAQSNLEGQGTLPVGATTGQSAAGALDMFGNVAEWVSTARGEQERFILGLGWSDPAYNVSLAMATSPWSRLPGQGFRLADYPSGPPSEALQAAVAVSSVDYDALELLPEGSLDLIAPLVAPRSAVHVVSEETIRVGASELAAMRVEIRSPSLGADPLPLYVLPPENAEPPYGAVIWFSGLNAIVTRDDSSLLYSAAFVEFIRESGRLVVLPVWTDTFSRNDGTAFGRFMPGGEEQLELASAWAADLGLTIDYLGTREDVKTDAIAFVGLSLGATVGSMILPRTDRIRAALLWSGGFPAATGLGSLRGLASLARRITTPILMLNGRYDFVFPLEGQRAYLRALGTPAEHKRHVVYDAGHFGWPLGEFVRENLDWLDRYLGPVQRPGHRLATTSEQRTTGG
jgi:dienelactone hydrolase